MASCNDDLEDRQKLAIFLHCLGEGRKLVTRRYPESMNFNSVAAKEMTFDMVWDKMNNLYQAALVADPFQPTEVEYQEKKDLSAVLAVFEDRVSPLTLRELQGFIQKDLTMDWIVKEYLKRGNQLIIDPETLADYPLRRIRECIQSMGW